MLKHKALVIVSILVLVLAVVAMSCAPAKPPAPPPAPPAPPAVTTPPAVATPPATTTPPAVTTPPAAPAVEIKTTFEAASYTNDLYGFSIKYPKAWTAGEVKLTGGVFYAKGGDDLVYVAVRPATDFKAASLTFLSDLIAASGASINPDFDSEQAVTFADGKTKGTAIMLSALFGSKKATVYGVIKDGKAIMVMCGTVKNNLDLYKEIGSTLSVK